MSLNEALEILYELMTAFDNGDHRISTRFSPSIEDINARQQRNEINNKSTQQMCQLKRSALEKQYFRKSNGILERKIGKRQERKEKPSKSKEVASHNVIRDLRIHIGGNGFYDAFIVSFTFLLIIIITTYYHA